MSDIIHCCEECGAVLPEGAGSSRRYCDACRKLRRKEINHNYKKKHILGESPEPPVVRYCTVCGKALPAGSAPNRIYCIPCSEKIHLEAARERARLARKAKPKEKLSPGRHCKVDKPCKECGTMMCTAWIPAKCFAMPVKSVGTESPVWTPAHSPAL